MEQTNQELVIILPEGMENTPVRIIRKEGVEELNVNIISFSEEKKHYLPQEKQHTFIWHQNAYERVSLDDIMWIEANGSYCQIHTASKKYSLSHTL